MKTPSRPPLSSQDLANMNLFQGLEPEELEEVVKAARIRQSDQGAYFFHEGDPAIATHVLISGKVILTQVTPEGQQVILRYIRPFEEFAIIAVLSETIYPVSAQAVEDSAALIWNRDSMQKLVERYPLISNNTIKILSRRVQEFQDRLRELSTERVERRIARALLRLVRQAGRKVPEGVLIDLPLSRQNLAEMTGTTLYTVSRILSQWESQGIVQSGRERVIIRQPHGLVTIAEDLPPDIPPEETD
jgi:CRP/FNR family transcriptional regulator, nitrogen oxide reductase regulator